MGKRGQKLKSDTIFDRAFGLMVKEARVKYGWSQGDLAANSSISETQISVIENGHESPRLYTIKALAVALGKTPSQLLDFKYDLKLNTNFSVPKKGRRKNGATGHINKLLDDKFFKTAKSVRNVADECQKRFKVKLRSAETSGVLLLLVKGRKLRKTRTSKGRNLYQDR